MQNKKSLVLGLALSLMSASSNAINVIIRNEYKKPIELYSGKQFLLTIDSNHATSFIDSVPNITAIRHQGGIVNHSGIKSELDKIRNMQNNGTQFDAATITILPSSSTVSFKYARAYQFTGSPSSNMPTRPTQPAPASQAQSPEAQLLAGNITVAAIHQYTEKLSRLDSSVRYPITNHASERLPIAQAIQLLYDKASGEEHQFFINEVKQMAQHYAPKYKDAGVVGKQNIELKFKADVAFSLKIRMSEWNSRK